ncbi:nitrite reductase large subunit NirB [Virgibacillus xinjiangensis]|uniref:Nitrite reductase large subunit NirB n=1 Tax=Virgibacillus xinjiangensis TaxID=393090 RepID=A0ABV7CRH1_9BACI
MGEQKLIMIGNGMAGVRCLQNILEEDPERYEITVFGREPHAGYSRLMLSSVLQGETSVHDIFIHQDNWYQRNNIQLYTGETVLAIDKEKKIVKTDKHREAVYDKLIIATGSSPFMLPIPGADKQGVMAFRTIEDCQRMMEASRDSKKAVVIGGGLLGLEAAKGLLNLGMHVDVVHINEYLMEKQLDAEASRMLQGELESQGMNFLMNKVSEEIMGEEKAEGIRFKDGTYIEAGLIVMATGVRPNNQLAKNSGIAVNRGIIVDDYMQTDSREIYAIGECVEHRGMVYGLVNPLYQQGEVLAKHLCGKPTNGYHGSTLSTQLKISGVEVFSAGQLTTDASTKEIHYQNGIESVYKKVIFQGNRVAGFVLFGDVGQGPRLLEAITKRKVVPDQDKAHLLEPTDPADSYVAVLPPGEHVCTCNSVSKAAIIRSVQENDLSTVEDVKTCTKASSSCGGCRPVVSELLDYIHSDYFAEGIGSEALCSCTTLTEEEVVEQIQRRNLKIAQEVREELGWRKEEGCGVCQPALDYYLDMIYPEYETPEETIYLNECMNAARLSDGTYEVVPQLYGGVLEAEQLKRIYKVVERYPLIRLAVAGDQRIHLSGIGERNLSNVCQELNMPLISRAGHCVETIKTSIGEHICRCDKEPSVYVAGVLEQKMEFLKTPYQVKIGISACVHNGAGSTTKDAGAIKIDRGWEIYTGGSSGRNARPGELLCVVETDEEVIQMILAFVQYYRESANYKERTWEWIGRVGLVPIREALFDKESRDLLLKGMDAAVTQRKSSLTTVST